MTTGIALLGAGIFAREEHLPAIEAAPSLTLKAVYSRSQKSAEALAAASRDPSSVAVYFDSPAVEGRSLDDLLRRDDVAAVSVVLPILQQPAVVEKAIRAGKHVLSEKPVASTVADAVRLIGWYESLADRPPLWGVAENWRYLESLRYAAQRVREIGGELVAFRLQMYGSIKPDNKYFNTEWRKVPQHQGGFLLDGGVHFVAGLRFLLAAAGQEVKKLAGFSALLNKALIPVDTVHAAAVTGGGQSGTIVISFGMQFKSGTEVEIVTTKGVVSWSPTEVRTVAGKGDGSGDKVEERKEFPYSSGVTKEVAAFADGLAAGKLDAFQSPREALKDLEILQALLESGDGGAIVKDISL
ncbi:oxidoreductase-like protein [Thermothelomyces thermophilus ATCC 42464]|uniref:Oxidoreductase-like protein n=1 Tax=Thermothelomyces thermophilus (strain ATCC 42464 / BCRC 31852 / DSM 1799) TaxID=573729 RepID=G2PZJ5_THET4|nr:oxidoreductase-like protein [Thermothelomyces thermophilus ATCC 42464]AEO55681.1 oxidoreductase-like protein [Thermothelomyces thermophilus ATCC 42464]